MNTGTAMRVGFKSLGSPYPFFSSMYIFITTGVNTVTAIATAAVIIINSTFIL